jgi:hypothetical protein
MGIISNTLLKIKNATSKTLGNAPGNSIVITGEGVPGQTVEKELYQNPGILASPGDDVRTIMIPVGRGRYSVCIAGHNYALNISVSKGGTVLYSTTPDGKTLKAKIYLKPDGSIELNGSSKTFVTHAELNTALQTFITALNLNFGTKLDGAGAPGVLSVDISSAATSTLKTGG